MLSYLLMTRLAVTVPSVPVKGRFAAVALAALSSASASAGFARPAEPGPNSK